jgi:selenocysteine lyase/cysteine desulfurase
VIDSLERGLPDLVRASVHYFNTEDELDGAVEAVGHLRP